MLQRIEVGMGEGRQGNVTAIAIDDSTRPSFPFSPFIFFLTLSALFP